MARRNFEVDADVKLISTIVLNWNRQELLEKTLESYAATIDGPAELIVIDNASTDRSKDVIAHFPSTTSIYLDQNLGGEAVNVALERATGDLIHISENDQVFLTGWSQHVRDCFEYFESLGQLSLFGVVPTDDEAWEVKDGYLRFARGKILYEAAGNVGFSSIIPAAVFRRQGVRAHNILQNNPDTFKFPDDARLSLDIKALGLWCAWSDRYYVRNLGHEINEFSREPEYYRQNYASKVWLGIDGWQRRIAIAKGRPRPSRRSVVFPQVALQPEKTIGEVAGKPAQLWSMFDGFTAETEVLDVLYALVRLVKPEHAVETGTWLGRSAVAIGKAMRDNGLGSLTTIEIDPEVASCARAEIAASDLEGRVKVVVGSSLDFQSASELEFALLDSDVGLRATEFRHFYERLAPGAVVVFHDTAPAHVGLAEGITALLAEGKLQGCFLQTPRGLFVGTVRRPAVAPSPSAMPTGTETGAAERELAALRTRLAALEGSKSWRLTKPLRAAMRAARTFRRQ